MKQNQMIISFLLFILLSCTAKSTDVKSQTDNDSIPEGAVAFEYDFKMKKQIMIPGTLNDSIPMRYWLETGVIVPIFSDGLNFKRNSALFEDIDTPMKIKIGNWEKTYGDAANPARYADMRRKSASGMHALPEWYGDSIGCIPWQFFKDRIIEISFSDLYIREIENFTDPSGYDGIKLEYKEPFLGIPVMIFTEGNVIKETLVFDTGFNGSVTFYDRDIKTNYNINTDYPAPDKLDTLKIGNNYLTDNNYIAFISEKRKLKIPFPGLLGTGVLENFDMILDLKNYYLYLKPVKNSNQ